MNRTELKWWKAPSPSAGVGRQRCQSGAAAPLIRSLLHCSFKSPASSLGVWQAALNTVHPQLCVQAVLGAEVVHSFGRLELKDNGKEIHSTPPVLPAWRWFKQLWRWTYIKEGFLLDVLRGSHGRRSRNDGLHLGQLNHPFTLFVPPALVVSQLGTGRQREAVFRADSRVSRPSLHSFIVSVLPDVWSCPAQTSAVSTVSTTPLS